MKEEGSALEMHLADNITVLKGIGDKTAALFRRMGVETVEEALQGAKDILAEDFSDDADTRKRLRENIQRKGSLSCSAATEEDTVYRLYYDFRCPVSKVQGY